MDMDKTKRLILTMTCWFAMLQTFAGRVEDVVNKFNRQYPQEKVFLHFDNTAYYANEIIWFKAYMLRTDNDSLGSLSRVLYVELLNPAGEVVETKKCLIENGTTHGEFMLEHYPGSGFYQVRAYTRYMLNWGNDCVFSRYLPVFSQPENKRDYSKRSIVMPEAYAKGSPNALPDAEDSSRYNVAFYPEGGHLVKGIKSQVGFQVTDGVGRSAHARGWLVVGRQNSTGVSTLQEGCGLFSYTPGTETARLKLVLPNGKTRFFNLPEAQESGAVLTVDASRADKLTWKICSSRDMKKTATQMLLVHNGKAQAVQTPLLRSSMPDGCSQLCLVDSGGRVLASRMVFNYPKNGLEHIDISCNDSTTWPGKTCSLDVRTTPKASVSLSVCDAETQLAANAHNAATWLLLSSDLKGYISNPDYYFQANDDTHRRDADLLMMVQGWRRYDVESMDGRKTWTKHYPVERQLLIDGKLKAYSKRNPVNGARLDIKMGSGVGCLLSGSVTVDSTGYYVFTVPDCWGVWYLLMHTMQNDKDKRYYITINRNFSPAQEKMSWKLITEDRPIVPTFSFPLDKAHIDSLPVGLRTMWLSQVEVKAWHTWRNPRLSWESESRGARFSSVRYDMVRATEDMEDQGQDMPTLPEWLGGKNQLFKHYGSNIPSGEYARSNPYNALYKDGPTYNDRGIIWIVNNRYIWGTGLPSGRYSSPSNPEEQDFGYFPDDISEIRSVYISTEKDSWKRFVYIPELEGHGITTIFVYTQPQNPYSKPGKGYRRTSFKGYSVPEEYTRMMHLRSEDLDGDDYRRTLYWNPAVELDSNGKATITFKNNSTSRNVTVSAMGFTQDGKPIVCEQK